MMIMTTVIDVFALLPDLIECIYPRPPIADACALVVNTLIKYFIRFLDSMHYLRARIGDRRPLLFVTCWARRSAKTLSAIALFSIHYLCTRIGDRRPLLVGTCCAPVHVEARKR